MWPSVACVSVFSNQLTTLEDVLQDHKKKVLYEDIQKTFRITVRRGHIFDDTLAMLRFGFDERKHLRVTFLGEAAVDEGGPRREFFMVLMGAISNNSSLLDGPADRRVLRHNISAFQVATMDVTRVCQVLITFW